MWKRVICLAVLCSCGGTKPAAYGEVERAALQQAGEALTAADYERAGRLVEDLLRKGRTPSLLWFKGLVKLRAGKAREAAKALEEAQALDPANVSVAAARVRAYLLDGQGPVPAAGSAPKAAAQKMSAALELVKVGSAGGDPYVAAVRVGDGDRNKTADALLRLGQAALRERRNEDAMAAFGEAVLLAPQAAAARLLLGSALYNMKAWKAAIGQLGEAAKLDARLVGAWKLLGHCYAQMNEKPSALEAYRRVLALAPNDTDVQAALARLEGRPFPPPAPQEALLPTPAGPVPLAQPVVQTNRGTKAALKVR